MCIRDRYLCVNKIKDRTNFELVLEPILSTPSTMQRASVNELAKTVATNRLKREESEKRFQKSGWGIIKKNETLVERSKSGLVDYFPIHKVTTFDSKFDVMKKILPTDFLMGEMEQRREGRYGGLTFEKVECAW